MSVIIERRLNLRLLAYWEKKRGLAAMPKLSDVEPTDLIDFWQFCFIVKIDGKGGFEKMHAGHSMDWKWLEPRLGPYLEQVVTKGAPCLEEGELTSDEGYLVKFRQCLMPLGDESGIQGILGGVRFRSF